jgi:prepilin-type N-terminal cleavage/methylation domain-containing protein
MIKKRGFSLIELLSVVAIIGIATAIVTPIYKNNIIKAKISQVVNIAPQYQTLVQAYYQVTGSAPTTVANLQLSGTANYIDIASGQLPLATLLDKITFATNGSAPTINFYIPVVNLQLASVNAIDTIILTYQLNNDLVNNLLNWSCSFTQGAAEFIKFVPAGCS